MRQVNWGVVLVSAGLHFAKSEAALIELVRMVRQQLPLAIASNFLVSIGAVWFFAHDVDIALLWWWFAAVMAINALRFYVLRDADSASFDAQQARVSARHYVLVTCLLGVAWGLFSFMPFGDDQLYPLMGVLMMTGMAGGALTSNAALVYAYYGFIFPILLPMAAVWLVSGGMSGIIIGIMTVVYGSYLIISAWRLNHSYREAIELRLEQKRLNDELQVAKSELDSELSERKIIEKDLQKVKAELEEAVGRLEYLSSIDSLTLIANRRSFDAGIAREWARCRRDERPIALLIIDVDYFKAYNDTYMHQAGDEVLKTIAQVLSDCARRPGDTAARYGGEEFALILADCSRECALKVADKVRQAVEALAIPHKSSAAAEYVTVSIGSMVVDEAKTDDYSILITEADRALYEAKDAGRNQVKTSWVSSA